MTKNKLQHLNIQYSQDPTEGGNVEATENDPLSAAAEGFEAPTFPVLAPDRIYRFRVVSSKISATKDDASRELLTIVLATEKDYTDKDGKPLRAGFKGYIRIGTTPSVGGAEKRDRTLADIGKELAMALKACGMAKRSPRELLNDPTIIEQCVVDCKAGIVKAKDNFPESNSFKWVLPG